MRPDDTRRILAEEEPERLDGSLRTAYAPRRAALRARSAMPAARKTLLWIAALICLALLAATAGETWSLWREQQMVAQTGAENQRIERDIQQTQQAIRQAQSPAVIEREARNLGYIRPGETSVIIAQPQP